MNRFFSVVLLKKCNYKKSDKGFTLVELIVSSSISLIVLTSGYYLSKTITQFNKNDKTQIELFSKIDSALDFLIDEINSGKRIISNRDKISTNCVVPEGDFILGISLPTQATDSSAYLTGSRVGSSWSEIDCPLIYYLKNSSSTRTNKITHNLWRYGPSINKEGFYQSISFSESLITDQISNEPLYEIKCSDNWTKINVKGISICIDSLSRTAEINITSNKEKFLNKDVYISKTSAGSNRIQDDLLMGINKGSDNDENSDNICSNLDTCNVFGTKIVGNVTFLIDISDSMRWGKPGYRPPGAPFNFRRRRYLIQGKTRIQAVKDEMIKLIDNLANTEFQIIAFGTFDIKLWDKAKISTESNKTEAKNWVSNLTANHYGTYPSQSLKNAIDNPTTQQVVLLSDGEPSITRPYCSHNNQNESIDSCISSYNELRRSEVDKGKVRIDTISLSSFLGRIQHCTPIGYGIDNWMGRLSSNNGGKCSVIR